MNAVEIESAVSELAAQPFDPEEFPYAFLRAFGNKDTTIKRLKSGESNKSDVGGVLQTKNIHILVAEPEGVSQALAVLKASPATGRWKANFILATDGQDFEAEDLESGETVACSYEDFPNHFGFFLPLAGITTVKQIRENAFDIRATSRLNKLYLELLKDNPNWGSAAKSAEMNHFMARLIFCFFAEDTGIFNDEGLFTRTVEQMSERDSSNTHEVISEIFRAMNTKREDRTSTKVPRWADPFPYVNGGLFSGSQEVPCFSRIARRYLVHIGILDWTQINPDIFGSMIQAVADDEERGALGMHYTSVPNILKVLNPLFLDDLRAKLGEAGDNPRLLLNLRKRMSRIRVFDPACGSGNFLVIAYKQMREIEDEIIRRRNELHENRLTSIKLTNFRGIEIRSFPAEIARLALVIAEYQCNVLYLGKRQALNVFLPLSKENWITCDNALRADWISICPATSGFVKQYADDLFETPLDQPEFDFENLDGETYVCGNPPYKGGTEQDPTQKQDLTIVFSKITTNWKSLDYVCGWIYKFSEYAKHVNAKCSFVCTNSITQGEQVARLWPLIFNNNQHIIFAHTSFKWSNLASNNAGVTVAVIGIGKKTGKCILFDNSDETNIQQREVDNISPYLIPYKNTIILPRSKPISKIHEMVNGNKPADGGNLILNLHEAREIRRMEPNASTYIRNFVGGDDSINGLQRFCLWIDDEDVSSIKNIDSIMKRIEGVREMRNNSTKELTRRGALRPHAFQQIRQTGRECSIVIPRHSSESREYLPISLHKHGSIIADGAFALYDAPLWNMSLLISKLHMIWIATVCGKLETRYRYSSTLGWNTFPVPILTEKNKNDLTSSVESIILEREKHFPSTISDLYTPKDMPKYLRDAHDWNDEIVERIYIGRKFRNNTERLEKLFDMYTQMTTSNPTQRKNAKAR